MNCQIINSDCLEALSKMPEASVECIVTSPPYGQLRTYGGFKWDFEAIAKELFRVLCDGGVLCWNVGDEVVEGSETLAPLRQAIYFKDSVGFCVHDTMIWHKLNFSSPSFNRYHQCFEYVFILSKGKPRTFNPIKDKQNSTAGRIGNLGTNTFMKRDGERETRSKYVTADLGMRHNVWKGKTRGQEDMCEVLPHPAMMPKWLARDLILSWSNHGDTVLDPFAGSGTTGKMALEVGRNAILIDSNPEYIPIIHNSTKVQYGLNLA
jgi:DNA modification methylase